MKNILFIAFITFCSFHISAKVQLPSLICDNMVIQRESEVRIWGKSDKNTKIYLFTSWNKEKYSTRSDNNGYWEIFIKTGKAGGPYSIFIKDKDETIINNILIGEVWLCSGQSNMEMPVQGFFGQPCLNSAETIGEAYKYPQIRLFTVKRNPQELPQDDCEGSWLVSTPKNVGAFSAVGYYFGKCLYQYLNIPIGLITTNWGGTNIETWMTKKSINKIDVNHDFINQNWTEKEKKPQSLYNGMINPLIKYKAKGFIWYQGESNRINYYDYKTLMVEMVRQWREAWNDNDMPFYYVQIAPYRYENPDGRRSALLIENQYNALKEIPHSGIVCTNDGGMFSLIHQPDKKSVGDRLAYLALSRDYNINGVPAESPTYKSMEINGDKVILSFNNLAAPDDQSDPRSFSWLDDKLNVISPNGFEIAGEDKVFYPAKARLLWSDNKIEVTSEKVKKPKAVRYAFKNFTKNLNIKTTLGMPLAPFRTDNWEIPESEIDKK